MSASGKQCPQPSPANSNSKNLKPNLNSLNSAVGNPNSALRVFASSTTPPVPSPARAPIAQQLLPRIQESLTAHGSVCPSLSSSRVLPSAAGRSPANQVVTVINPTFFNVTPAIVGVPQVCGFAPTFVTAAVVDPVGRVLRSPLLQQWSAMPVRAVSKNAGIVAPRIGAPVVHAKVYYYK